MEVPPEPMDVEQPEEPSGKQMPERHPAATLTSTRLRRWLVPVAIGAVIVVLAIVIVLAVVFHWRLSS